MSIIYLAVSALALGLVAEKAGRRSGMVYFEATYRKRDWNSKPTKLCTTNSSKRRLHRSADTALKTDKLQSAVEPRL